MSEPKPLASLSSNLLARKGQAAPAMRRQGMISLMTEATASGTTEHSQLEDLGWNDMGHDSEYLPGHAGRAGLSPMASPHEAHPAPQPQVAPISPSVEIEDVVPAVPEVVRQQQLVRETAVPAQPVVAEPSFTPKAAPKVANRAAPGSRGKAAFTLRLDADRHLQLRLACALNHRSAQQIVTEALDAYLGGLSIAEQLSAIRKTGKA